MIKTISVSKLTTFQQCPRLFYWENVLRIAPKVVQFPFVVGNIVHMAVEMWYKTGEQEKVRQWVNSETLKYLSSGKVSQQEYDEKLAIIEGMVLGYIEKDKNDLWNWETLGREISFSIPFTVDGTVIEITGRVDAIVRGGMDVWVLELKTRTNIDQSEFDLYPMQYQPRMYNWVFSKGYNGFPKTKGVFLDMIKKPSIRRRVKSGESQAEFTARLRNEYANNPEKYFAGQTIMIPSYLAEQFEEEMDTLVRDIHQKCSDTRDPLAVWPTNPCQCDRFGTCPYLDLCRYGLNRRTAGGFIMKDEQPKEETVEIGKE